MVGAWLVFMSLHSHNKHSRTVPAKVPVAMFGYISV